MFHDEENVPMMSEGVSPYVDKMRQYVDIERDLERLAKDMAVADAKSSDLRSKQAHLRRALTSYLEPDRVAEVSA